ncbi:hypothetical protein Lbru_2320 [Legionella brunensis]|uniref:Uncharacterized protein n=2 Tax=Legionella brunensis TaxID=29422 RepID=A0A0W0S3I9_9GAMM|nr:hypothetical protein Lbru_2320 [Legionella brunensis]
MKRTKSVQNLKALSDSETTQLDVLENDDSNNNNNSKKSPISGVITKFKNRFFKTKEIEPNYSYLLDKYKIAEELLLNFLQDETKSYKFSSAAENLDFVLFLIEKNIQISTRKFGTDFYEFAAKCFYLRASLSLMKASEHGTEQVTDCKEAIEYMEVAIDYGLPYKGQTQVLQDYASELEEKHLALKETIQSYNKKSDSTPLMRRSLQVSVCEKNLGNSLTNYYSKGFVELNQQIKLSATEMMNTALDFCTALEEKEQLPQVDYF